MKVMLAAGELSGDMHGAHLARALKNVEPQVQLLGMGGSLMREAGVRILFDPTRVTTMGLVEVLKGLRFYRGLLRQLTTVMDTERPDALVLIDFPGFNMRLAKVAHAKGVPVLYYFSPSAWAWGRGRAKKLARIVTRIISVFPFEAQVYREAGAEVTFVGHPLVDITAAARVSRKEAQRDLVPEGDGPVIGLLPGSRKQEIDLLLPELLEAARRIKDDFPAAVFLLPIAASIDAAALQPFLASAGVQVKTLEGRAYEVMAASDLVLVSSGTATLEAACFGTPMVVVYRMAQLTYRLGRILVKIPYISLPNIVAGKKIVPELIQEEATGERIAAEAVNLLRQPEDLARMREDLGRAAAKLGKPGAVEKAARVVIEVAQHYGRRSDGHSDHRQ